MSKLADAIRRSQRTDPAPMGFGAARPAAKATMLVGYAASADALAAAKDAGADLLLLDSRAKGVAAADAAKVTEAVGGAVVGLCAPVDGDVGKALKDSGIDFLVFDPESTPAAALLNDDLGYVLMLPKDPEELFLRSIASFSLDALFLNELPATLTVGRQIELTRIANLAGKPLVCFVKADISSEELQCLRAAGVAVLVVEGDVAGIATLKASVLALPQRKIKRDERPGVSLPRTQTAPEHDHDDDDDDD